MILVPRCTFRVLPQELLAKVKKSTIYLASYFTASLHHVKTIRAYHTKTENVT